MRRARVELHEVSDLIPLARAARRSAQASPKSLATLSFLAHLEDECLQLSEELKAGIYRPLPFHSFLISDPKPRQICAAPFRDRVVHHSLCAALSERFERYAHPHSYACRVGKGTHAALDRAQRLIRGSTWALKLDVHHFFERAQHDYILGLIERLIKGREIIQLCETLIRHAPPSCVPGRGLPIGNLTSQHFANLYLGPLDHYITSTLGISGYVRYMDDLLIVSDDRERLLALEQEVSVFVRACGLTLKPKARQLCLTQDGVPFLGVRLWAHHRRLDQARRRRLHRKLKRLSQLAPQFMSTQEGQLILQDQLTATWGWASKGGGEALFASWLERRDLGSLFEPL